jgi:hypothetical protein
MLPRVLGTYRIGADENGLGARLGPLVVTAVLARVDERGTRALARRLPKKIRALVADSKELVSHGNVAIGEAWARTLVPDAGSPNELFERLSLEGSARLHEPCPDHVRHQCWRPEGEQFAAPDELLKQVHWARQSLLERGIEVMGVKSSVVCVDRLNVARESGKNRFISDLHAMESLVLALRREAGSDVVAICGKVGGMGDYSRFFGPLGGWLHVVLEQGKRKSGYRFPGVGELYFVQDADGPKGDALVMLASLVGKYLRELLMARVARWYGEHLDPEQPPSGYHDPVTARFVEATELVRRRRRVPSSCFERVGPIDA